MLNIEPVNNYLLIEVLEEEKGKNLFVVSDSAKKNSHLGKVLKVADGKVGAEEHISPVKVGDQILFLRDTGTDVDLEDDKKYKLITFDSVLATIQK